MPPEVNGHTSSVYPTKEMSSHAASWASRNVAASAARIRSRCL
jgi:hypothetical protein